MSTFLGFLSDNCQNQSQSNTVVVQQEKVDRVGFEPTTSAMLAIFYLRAAMERELKCSKQVRRDAAENKTNPNVS
jgi:hypothetical protein